MAQYTVLFGENIYLLALKLYGAVDYSYRIVSDNDIQDINEDLTGRVIEFDETIKATVLNSLVIEKVREVNNTKTYTAKEGMSIFDICLNTVGDLEQIVKLLKNSSMANITSPTIGASFTYTARPNDLRTWAKGIEFASAITIDQARAGSFDSGFDQQAFL